MNLEVVLAILFRGPAGVEGSHMMPQFIADAQSFTGRHARFLLRPATPFERSNGSPVAASEGDYILSSHRLRIAEETACTGEGER